jgi:hypothetical protein
MWVARGGSIGHRKSLRSFDAASRRFAAAGGCCYDVPVRGRFFGAGLPIVVLEMGFATREYRASKIAALFRCGKPAVRGGVRVWNGGAALDSMF